MPTFQQFYEKIGFEKYPFREKTAEKEDTSKIFIAPPDFSVINDAFESGDTAIISGNRGTGKTILLDNLRSKVYSDTVILTIGNYESVAVENNLHDFYDLILKNLVTNTLVYFLSHKKALKKLTIEEKELLSFLITKYADDITNSGIVDKIEKVQLSFLKRMINKVSVPLTSLLNFGTTAAANFGYEVLNQNFSSCLPNINEGKIRKIIPDIQFRVRDDFRTVTVSYLLLDKALVLVQKLSEHKPIIMFDKFDEDLRLENDAELISEFIKGLICDNKLLLNDHMQLLISVWEIPFVSLQPIFRQSKHTVFKIHWKRTELENVLNRRLSTYSNNKINDYKVLFDADVTSQIIDKIFEISNMNPRDLWTVLSSIFKQQYEISASSTKLSSNAIENGIMNFVKEFDFYEYYPQKKNAHKNTNDVYSYIRHLLRLDNTDEFTNNELRESASTGGSTTNYISGMMAMGLVSKIDKKRAGGAVVYKVNDPKVSYAIFNKVDIGH